MTVPPVFSQSLEPELITAMSTHRQFNVRGMDCAEEIGALKMTVGALKGVSDLAFNLIDGTMSVFSDAATQRTKK